MEHFAGYGFNKSHSCAYALVAYQTAYLKAHHPLQFMAALLTTETEDTDNIVKYVGECRDMGIEVLPPDVGNERGSTSRVEGERIRFGLGAVKNVGESAIESILEARRRLGTFRGIGELCENTDQRLVNKRVIESLVKAGAFDGIARNRAKLCAGLDLLLDAASRAGSREGDRSGESLRWGVVRGGGRGLRGTTFRTSPNGPTERRWPSRRRLSAST